MDLGSEFVHKLEKDSEKEFKKISTKKITKRLLNEYYYMKRFVYISTFSIVFLIIVLFSNFTKSDQSIMIITYTVIFFFTSYMFLFYFRIQNNDFVRLESYKRQYYILFLMCNIIQCNDKKKKYKLWALIRRYNAELNKIISQIRSQKLFEIYDYEKDIIYLRKNISEKIIGNILEEKYQEEIHKIIKKLVLNTYLINNDEFVLKLNHDNYIVSDIKNEIFKIFDSIDVSNKKIEYTKINQVIKIFQKCNADLILVSVLSIMFISSYILISTYITNSFDIGILYGIILATPAFIAFFLNQIKKK